MTLKWDLQYKIILLGDPSVGKTELVNRISKTIFSSYYKPTIDHDTISSLIITFGCKKIKLDIVDTAGQERLNTFSSNYLLGIDAVVLCFDITNLMSFLNIDRWNNEFIIATSLTDVTTEELIKKGLNNGAKIIMTFHTLKQVQN
ncbi:hypothetical protein HZS_6954 [Henneguya salminicola]|nr:hypothetical protein HZS_6954 [Henneguya salminicola]